MKYNGHNEQCDESNMMIRMIEILYGVTRLFIGYEMNVFKLSLYFSHFFQMQMLRRFGIVTHCQKNCTATQRLGKQNTEGNDPKQQALCYAILNQLNMGTKFIYILSLFRTDIFPCLGLHSMEVMCPFLSGSLEV